MDLSTQKKEQRKMFFKVMKAVNSQCEKYKMVHIGNAQWGNEHTKTIQKVNDLYILGFESSGRPIIIKSIELSDTNNRSNTYEINGYLSHTNLSSSMDSKHILLIVDGKPYNVYITGQAFCNPMSAFHVFEGDEKEVAGVIRANLLSQNYDDAFSSVESVSNSERDMLVNCNITRESSPIELILSENSYNIKAWDKSKLKEELTRIKNIKDNEIWAKKKDSNYYSKVLKDEYRKMRYLFSDYYPAFDKKYIDSLNIELSKDEFDLGVYGLGSAGTAILDQICRSNWVKTIYLCDFDEVEAKNLNNQWYTNESLRLNKTAASKDIIQRLNREVQGIKTEFKVITATKSFQNTDYKDKKFKYVVSGFDSIKVRQEFFEKIKSGEIEAEYLIDCRYLDLSSSIYIVDIHNKEQMDFYEANLNEDAKLFEQKEKENMMTEEEFYDWLELQNPFESKCSYVRDKYFNDDNANKIISRYCHVSSCSKHDCKYGFYKAYLETFPNNGINKKPENTCIKQNYIDIYKYTGAIIFGAIRNIENGKNKPFTLIEAETDIKGLPNYMLVRG